MEFEMILKLVYNFSGILVALFFLFVANTLRKEKQEIIKSRIFIKYNRFRTAFYIALIGSILFLLGNIADFSSNELLHVLHEVGEILYNLSLVAFVGIIYFIVRIQNHIKSYNMPETRNLEYSEKGGIK